MQAFFATFCDWRRFLKLLQSQFWRAQFRRISEFLEKFQNNFSISPKFFQLWQNFPLKPLKTSKITHFMTENTSKMPILIEISSFCAYFWLKNFLGKCCNLSFGDFGSVSADFSVFRLSVSQKCSQFRRPKWQKKPGYSRPEKATKNRATGALGLLTCSI